MSVLDQLIDGLEAYEQHAPLPKEVGEFLGQLRTGRDLLSSVTGAVVVLGPDELSVLQAALLDLAVSSSPLAVQAATQFLAMQSCSGRVELDKIGLQVLFAALDASDDPKAHELREAGIRSIAAGLRERR